MNDGIRTAIEEKNKTKKDIILTFFLIIKLYILCPNMELADKTDESALDITAAEIAPRPIKETHPGVRYCKTMGKTSRVSSISLISTPFLVELISKPASSAPSIWDQSK